MNVTFRDITTSKTGIRTIVLVNIKSLKNVDLFKNIMFKNICRCGYNCKSNLFHDLIHSSRNLKYYNNNSVEKTEDIFNNIKYKYYRELNNI